MTDPMGRVFVSYRRKRITETNALILALRDRGIPIWRDVNSLQNEPTEDAIRQALEDPLTSGAVLWISPDVAESNIIKHVEVPLAIKRYRRNDGFWLIIVLAGGTDYGDLTGIFGSALGTEDLSSWNVTKVSSPTAKKADIIRLSQKVLARRLEALVRTTGEGEALQLTVDAKGTFRPLPPRALAIDWTAYFLNRIPGPSEWRLMSSAWNDVSASVKRLVPRETTIHVTGTPSLPSALLMGSGFSTRDGMVPAWIQRMPDGVSHEEWTHSASTSSELARNLGWTSAIQHRDANATALAVLINASDNVELAVGRSRNSLPAWRAVLAVNPSEGRNARALPLSASEVASVVHLSIDALREARQNVQPIDSIHLFVAGPAGLGLLLGTQLATLPPLFTYEFDTVKQVYVTAARITT